MELLEPLEPLELELLEPLEPLWPLKLLEPLFPMRQGSLGEVIRASLQGSEKVPMLLAKAPGEEGVVSKGRSDLASSLSFQAHLSHLLLISPARGPGRVWGGKGRENRLLSVKENEVAEEQQFQRSGRGQGQRK